MTVSAGSEQRALAPSSREDVDLETRRRRVKIKAEALRDRLQHEADKIDDKRQNVRDFVVRYRWPLLGATTALGYAVAGRRQRRRHRGAERVVVVDSGSGTRVAAKRGTALGFLAGRALELAAKAALHEVQDRLDGGSFIRRGGEDGFSDE